MTYIFFAAIFLIVYAFALYPYVLKLLAAIFRNPPRKDINFKPSVSIVISAFNEERIIERALRSIFDSDYPREKIEVLVGSDGSTDATEEIVSLLERELPSLKLYKFPRTGKNGVLNSITPRATGEIILYMDADVRLQPDTISVLVANFADGRVGAAIAAMSQIDESDNSNSGRIGETLYQSYEHDIRIMESVVWTTVNSLGAFYGVRRADYAPLPNDMVCDDFMPLLTVSLMRKRVIFDPAAKVLEVREKSLSDELARRARVASGAMSTVWAAKKLLLPNYGVYSFFLWSHKILRWLSPFFLIIILCTNLFLLNHGSFFIATFVAQATFYALSLAGLVAEKFGKAPKALKIPAYAVTMNYGFLLAFHRFLSGKSTSRWERSTF
ncbi:MAG: glycosyltransferase [Chloroflexota bacterium]